MLQPILIDPNDPNVVTLPSRVARPLLRLHSGALRVGLPTFPPIVRWEWGGRSFTADGIGLDFQDGVLCLELAGFHWLRAPGFRDLVRDPNNSATLEFVDGTRLVARFASWTGTKTTIRSTSGSERHVLELDQWTRQPAQASPVWVGSVKGRKLGAKNVCLHSRTRTAWAALRVESTYDLHVIGGAAGELFILVDAGTAQLDQKLLANDLQALEPTFRALRARNG